METDQLVYRCSFCSFRCLSWREFNRHNFETHSNEPNFIMKCVVVGCSQTFRCYSTFASHLSRKHRGVDFESEARLTILLCNSCSRESEEVNAELSSGDASAEIEMDTGAAMTSNNDASCNSAENDISSVFQMQGSTNSCNRLCRFAALFLITAKERYQLTQSALDFITRQMQQMISFAVDDIDEAVRNYLAEQGLTRTPFLNEQLENLRNPFMHLQTEYLQNKYYRENFNLVVSMHLLLYILC